MLQVDPRRDRIGRWPVRWVATQGRRIALQGQRITARGREWVRRWAGVGFIAILISALGLAVAAATDLLDPPPSSAASRTEAAHVPAPLPVFDRTAGAAPPTRLHTPARSALLLAQRHYALATDRQAVSEAVLRDDADQRHRALRAVTNQTRRTQEQIAREREHRRVVALVSQQFADRLREIRAAAAATARQQRATGQQPPVGGVTARPGNVGLTATGLGAMPVASGAISARFGDSGSWSSYHTGVDFRAAYGEPVHAAAAGVVVFAGNTGDWAGNHVAVQHAGGVTTMYSHLSSISVAVGQSVLAGQLLGLVGQTGRAFGPHLHFEVYPPGVRPGDVYRAVDPLPWLAGLGVHPY